MRAHLPLALLPILAACGSDSPPLHERQAFTGEVELRGEGGGAIEGRLMFRRESGNLQFTIERDEVVVSLARDAEGRVRAFQETVWRDPTEREVEWFRMVEAVVQPRGDGDLRESNGSSYAVQVDGHRVDVRILAESAPHGGR